MVTAYLDTCIVSGLAKQDLPQIELNALLSLLRANREGRMRIVTSEITGSEIEKVPEQYRLKHEVIFNLLSQLPLATRYAANSGLMLMGVGGGRREDPLAAALKGILDDDGDLDHMFQAAKNGATHFVTTDLRTIGARAPQVLQACGVIVVRPAELAAALST